MAEEGASSEAPRKIVGHIGFKPCFFPGCIKQAKHVGRHKVRLPDGGIPERGAWRNVRARRESPPPREPLEPGSYALFSRVGRFTVQPNGRSTDMHLEESG